MKFRIIQRIYFPPAERLLGLLGLLGFRGKLTFGVAHD